MILTPEGTTGGKRDPAARADSQGVRPGSVALLVLQPQHIQDVQELTVFHTGDQHYLARFGLPEVSRSDLLTQLALEPRARRTALQMDQIPGRSAYLGPARPSLCLQNMGLLPGDVRPQSPRHPVQHQGTADVLSLEQRADRMDDIPTAEVLDVDAPLMKGAGAQFVV